MDMSNGDGLNRDSILGLDDLPVVEVVVPEWGGSVWVRGMTGTERDAFEEKGIGAPLKDMRARVAIATVCDHDGNLLFTDQDLPALMRKSGKALDRILIAAAPLSGLSKEDIADLKKN